MKGLFDVFVNRRSFTLLVLGFASGLPFALTGDTLSAWLSLRGISVEKIGLFSLVALPYALKFLWSPLLDRFVPPVLGRRRGWLLISQILLIPAIAAMAFWEKGASLKLLAVWATVVAMLSATQDIVVDAYRTDLLPPEERGTGAAAHVTGYRIALIAASAGALLLVGKIGASWHAVYILMAAAMAIGVVATLLAPEPRQPAAPPRTLSDAVVLPMEEMLLRRGGLVILAVVFLFKVPEYLAAAQTMPFLLKEMRFAPDQVGYVRQVLGFGVTIFGAFLGGGIVARIGVWRSLWIFGVVHCLTNLSFLLLSRAHPSTTILAGVIFTENLGIGLTTAGFTAFLMSLCDVRFSATQYALLSGLMALSRVASGSVSGAIEMKVGWTAFFAISAVSGLPALVLLPWVPRDELVEEIEPSEPEAILVAR